MHFWLTIFPVRVLTRLRVQSTHRELKRAHKFLDASFVRSPIQEAIKRSIAVKYERVCMSGRVVKMKRDIDPRKVCSVLEALDLIFQMCRYFAQSIL